MMWWLVIPAIGLWMFFSLVTWLEEWEKEFKKKRKDKINNKDKQ